MLSTGKSVMVPDLKAYLRVNHGLSESRIETFEVLSKWAKDNWAVVESEFEKIQKEDKDSNKFKNSAYWGRNRGADKRLLNVILKLVRQYKEVSLYDLELKVVMPWRLLNFGAQRIKSRKDPQASVVKSPKIDKTFNAIPTQAEPKNCIIVDNQQVIDAYAKKYGITAKKAKLMIQDMPTLGADFVNKCLTCSCDH